MLSIRGSCANAAAQVKAKKSEARNQDVERRLSENSFRE